MSQIALPELPGSLQHIDVTQGQYRDQIGAVAQLCRQVGGNADLAQEVLTSKYTLYVSPDTGRDDFVPGEANFTTGLTRQQASCGYSIYAPFKTIQRALLEAARISVIAGPENDKFDRVVILVAPGEHMIDNGLSRGFTGPWTPPAGQEAYVPTAEDLRSFNGIGRLGVIIPRGVSIVGADLRKTVVRPLAVPPPTGNPSTGRGAIFRATGTGFFFTFSFKDNPTFQQSHHLLHCFEFCSEEALALYYEQVASAFGLNKADIEIRDPEIEIAAPYPKGLATPATDTTKGSSCYIFNCSLRSDYGMCGIFLDGDEVTGFKSMVTAQFTNVSLQRDMNAWQLYSNGNWATPPSYQAYIDQDVNNIRYNVSGNYNVKTGCYETDWRHFAFKVINDAIIQEVSCFVIGDAVHHWTASGGECTITNSNSNFGATALLSSGFRGIGTGGGAFQQDQDFTMIRLRRPLRMKQDGSNVRQVSIGLVQSYDHTTGRLTLDRNLDIQNQLAIFGYSLAPNSYLWIENRSRDTGPGYIPGNLPGSTAVNVRALMSSNPFDTATPNRIQLNPSNDPVVNNLPTISPADLVGNRVFLRRLIDNRGTEEREYALMVANTKNFGFRRPLGNYVVRLGGASQVGEQLDPTLGAGQVYLVSDATPAAAGVLGNSARSFSDVFRLVLRPADLQDNFKAGNFYRVGNAVFHEGRVKRSKRNGVATEFLGDDWEPSVSMLLNARGLEQSRVTQAPLLVIDRDSSNDPASQTLGVNLDSDADVLGQIRSAADFQAVNGLMIALGYVSGAVSGGGGSLVGTVLQPQAADATRNWDPMAESSPIPTGKLNSRRQWPLEFNRPSLIRAFGHAYEWAGLLNYTKAMPKYQTSVLSDQNKIDFFGVSHSGGRVYNTGFNEDGLLVQGDTIRDLSTGRTSNTDVAGVGGISGDPDFENIPTTFEDLTVTDEFNSLGRANMNNVVFNGFIDGSPTWAYGTLPIATVDEEGILRLASAEEVSTREGTKAMTAQAWGDNANIAGGWLELDASTKIDPRFLPLLDGSLLPLASTTKPGIIEIADQTEAAGGTSIDRAITPQLIAFLRGRADGLAALNNLGQVPANQLAQATETLAGVLELATNPEAIAYLLTTVGITPANIGFLRNRRGGLAGLDDNGLLDPNVIPGGGATGVGQLPIRPKPWVPGADNFKTTMNFTWSHTDGATLQLGAPLTTGYEGVSGFIDITNTSTTPVTAVNSSVWRPVQNAFMDPVFRVEGLTGNLLFTYYVQSATRVVFDVAQVT
jgi:hypothetical protein